MGRPKVMPIRDNRQSGLDYFIRARRSKKRIEADVAFASSESAAVKANDSHKWSTAVLSSGTVAAWNLTLAVDSIIAGRARGWQDAMHALAVGYLSSELMKHQREKTLGLYCRRLGAVPDLYNVAFYGVLAGLRLWPQADCLCRHLMNFWLGRGADDALTYGPLLLLPAELLAFKAIYERATSKTCDLHAEHPVLKTGLLDPPAGLSLPENDLTACLHETGKAVFGSAWQPGAFVEVRFDNPPVLPDETPASKT
jgi:hypothetical protein